MKTLMQVKNVPYLLSGWSVMMAVIGIIDQGIEPGRAASLIFALLLFSILLVNSLESYLYERTANQTKANFLIGFIVVFSLMEAFLLHYGLMWVVDEKYPEWVMLLASAAFVYSAIYAKWAYTPTVIPEEPEEKVDAGPPLKEAADLLEGAVGQ